MKRYIFSLTAVTSILVECYRSGNDLETGGILVGPNEYRQIITDVIPSSAYAERRVCTYYQSEKDTEILNAKLSGFQARNYDFRGYFHRHPTNLSELSKGDIDTCRGILENPDYKIDNSLLMCIITEKSNNFPIFCYVASLDEGEVIVTPVAMKVLPGECIKEFIGEDNNENINSGHYCSQDKRDGKCETVWVSAEGHISDHIPSGPKLLTERWCI